MKRTLFIALLLFSSCASIATVELPLRHGDILLPEHIAAKDKDAYLAGFRAGWTHTIRVYVDDIDHRLSLLDYAGKGEDMSRESIYDLGWHDAHAEAERVCMRLIETTGKKAAHDTLQEALGTLQKPIQSSQRNAMARPIFVFENRSSRG